MFVVATATFRILYALIVLGHDRRKVIHFEVSQNPTQVWLSRQMTEAFPWDTAPRYLLRDRDTSMVGPSVIVLRRWASKRSSPRRGHPGRIPMSSASSARSAANVWITSSSSTSVTCAASSRAYFQYHHRTRTHLSLDKDCPQPRQIQPPSAGKIIAFPEVGGLHHRYERRAA